MSIWLQLISTLVRAALFALFGKLALRGLISDETAKQLAESGVYYVVLVGTPLILVGWSMFEKWLQRLRELAALESPANAPREVVDRRVREKIRERVRGDK